MEGKKINVEGLEGKALETANQFNALVDKISAIEQKNASIDALQTELKNLKEASKEAEFEKKFTELENDFTKRVNEIESKMTSKETERTTLAKGILIFFESKGIKTIDDVKKFLKAGDKEMEFKADVDTADFTGNVLRTISPVTPRFAPLRPMAFIPFAKVMSVGTGKNRCMWIPASYTSNVGYAGEGSGASTADTAAAQEKYREFAKVAAKMTISAETFEDLPLFANQLAMQMQENALVWADGKMWDGDGNDSTQAKHIYGLKTQGVTAFDASLVPDIDNANVADLIDACVTQIKLSHYSANAIWVSPGLAFKIRRMKDKDGQYLVKELVTGETVINNLKLIETEVFTNNEMLVGNTMAIQLWIKRNFILKFGQFGDAVETDTYKALLFARIQNVVEDEDKKALIYVSDVTASVNAINVDNG